MWRVEACFVSGITMQTSTVDGKVENGTNLCTRHTAEWPHRPALGSLAPGGSDEIAA